MGLVRTILRPAAYLAGRHATRQLNAFIRAHRRTRSVQDDLLRRLLASHANTAFGRDHSFGSIRSWEDFKAAVPLQEYESLRPYIQRVLEGDTGALLPPGEQVLMFSLTSGTTGEPKHIPVTRRFLADIRRAWNIFGMAAYHDHPEAWLRPILQITSPINESTSPTGLPCGAISGLLAATQKRVVQWMYTTSPHARAAGNPEDKYYTLLRCAAGRDVSFITTANPSSTIKLIETGQAHFDRLIRDLTDGTLRPPGDGDGATGKLRFRPNRALARRVAEAVRRDGKLLGKHLWKVSFLANWTGGTLGLYLPRLRELFEGVPVRDIGLLASEGRFSIPICDGSSAGLAEITGNFLEFIPAADYEQAHPATLRADQLDIGEEYFLVTSNWAGLWRYSMDDRIRVTDRFGQSPVFEFLSRGRHTANITGEKITEHQVVEAMRLTGSNVGLRVQRFVLQGRFAQTPYYELRLELTDPSQADRVAQRMDEELGKLNMEYRTKRASGRLGVIRAIRVGPHRMDQIESENVRRRRGRSEQYKHQYLLTEVLAETEKSSQFQA